MNVLPLIPFVLIPLAAHATPPVAPIAKDVQGHIRQLVARSRQAEPECRSFDAEQERLIDRMKDDAPRTRADFEHLLELVERYPGTPAAAEEARDLVLRNPDLDWFQESSPFWKVYSCVPLAYFDAAKGVILGAAKFDAVAASRGRIGDGILGGIRRELRSRATLFDVMIGSALLRELKESGVVKLTRKQSQQLDGITKDSLALKGELRRGASDQPTPAELRGQILKEMGLVPPIQRRLATLIAQLDPG